MNSSALDTCSLFYQWCCLLFVGSDKLWYGHADIVLLSSWNSNVVCLKHLLAEDSQALASLSEENTVIDEVDNMEDNEVKGNSHHIYQDIISQTITNSLYQTHRSYLTLVPVLLLTSSSFFCILYDHVGEFLLRSRLTGPLWDTENECEFSMSAILKIWMVGNYDKFKPSLQGNQVC